jgi:hypothetical protein
MKKILGFLFIIPQLVMGILFAGVSGFLFLIYEWPAIESYQRGEFGPQQSLTVLSVFVLFTAVFFIAGLAMFFSGVRALARLIEAPDNQPIFGEVLKPAEKIEARNRVLGMPRMARRMIDTAANGAASKSFLKPLLQPDGWYEIKSHSFYKVIGIFLLVFALFWNGFIGFALFDLMKWSWTAIVFGLFLLPFVAIGLGLLGGALYFLSLLRYPELTIRIKPDFLSRQLRGTWRFSKRPTGLKSLSIHFSVSEKQITGTGEDATTKTIPVMEEKIVEAADLRIMQNGDFTYRWPESLELPNESPQRLVVWSVNFRASAAYAPDLRFWVPIEKVT